jgi:hypothetical protein
VLWTDESPFPLFISPGRNHLVWYLKTQGISHRLVIPTVKHGGGSIMVWGAFHAKGMGPLKRLEGIIDGSIYHGILVAHAVPKVRQLATEYPSDIPFYLQQDNAPVHTAAQNKS